MTYTAEKTEKRGKTRSRPMVWAAVVLLAGIIVLTGSYVLIAHRQGTGSGGQAITRAAMRGPLTISVTESGTIRSRQQEVIKNELEGQTTILYLIPEGTLVQKGDLLVQLDASRLEDQKIEADIRVQNAEAAFIRARENLEVVRSQGESDVAKAELDYRFAKEDLDNYIGGNYPKDLLEAENRITLAEQELKRVEDKFEWSEKLFEEKYISKTELEADDLAVRRARLDLQLAEKNLELLKEFTYKRQLAELESNIEQTKRALDRVKLSRNADLVQAQAELRAKDSEYDRQKMQLSRVERQIERATIVAPTEGMAIHATSAQSGRGNTEPLAEGQSVRERQDLIYLPTTSAATADIKVHEATLQKVRLGLPVRITIDALPGRQFTGRVARIAPLPDSPSWWSNPDMKVFSTEIHIDGDGSDLRTGMTCQAEIVVEYYDDAIYVPVQAVTRLGKQPVVYVHNGRESQVRPIELGLDNNRMARIKDGLAAGERVLLNPPLAEAMADAPEDAPVAAERQAAATPAAAPVAPAAAATENPALDTERQRGERTERGQRGQRPDMANLTEEQRQEMRRRLESMTPEQREELRRRRDEAAGG